MFNVAKGNVQPQFPDECSTDLKDFIGKCLRF